MGVLPEGREHRPRREASSRLDGAGSEPGQHGVREWLEELRDLFGQPVAEQVVGRAAERGRSQARLELDPESVMPSVGLLQELLAPKCGLPPYRLARLRRLANRVVRELLRELAARLRAGALMLGRCSALPAHSTCVGRPRAAWAPSAPGRRLKQVVPDHN